MALNIRKVLISDKVAACCKDVLAKQNICVDYKPGMSKDELKAVIKGYDALIVRSATKVTADVFESATSLKLVGRAGTGVDNIDLVAASKHGVLVMNTPGGNTLSAAEHTCALISTVSRHIGQGYASMIQGKWERSKFMGCELMGKVLAIIGLGRIGREVALRMQSYGMRTIGYDPIVPAEEAKKFGIEFMECKDMWPLADYITVHVPLIPPTKGMINKSVLELCKPTVRVINVARGGIINETELLEALNEDKCGGAALDVFETEPPKEGSVSFELVKHPKVLSTPHLGASTSEAQTRVAKEIAEQIVDAVQGKPIFGLVNAPELSQSSNEQYQPWVKALEKFGKLTGRLYCEEKELQLTICGMELKDATKLMGTAFGYGVALSRKMPANIINSRSLLKEAGIEVKVTFDSSNDAPGVRLTANGITSSMSVNNGSPLLYSVSGIDLVTPISLNENLIIASSTTQSPKNLLKLLNGTEITGFSSGTDGKKSIVVATVEGLLDQAVPSPFTFFQH